VRGGHVPQDAEDGAEGVVPFGGVGVGGVGAAAAVGIPAEERLYGGGGGPRGGGGVGTSVGGASPPAWGVGREVLTHETRPTTRHTI